MPALLEGVVEEPRQPIVLALEAEIGRLNRELRETRAELARARAESAHAVAALRQQLSPLYRALQAIFGELDAIGDDAPAPASDARMQAVWASWKSKLGSGPAKVIDALLLHGEMNTQQLAIACGVNRNTIPNWIVTLNKAGLINKNGGRFSLKSL